MDKKYVFIAGAKSDIAKSIAHRYASLGYNLYLGARQHTELENDVSNFKIRYDIQCSSLELDMLDFNSHENIYKSLDPKPDIVICVAGYMGDAEKAMSDFDEAQKIMMTNYNGCVSFLNIAAADMQKRQSGTIIGISSVAGDRGRSKNIIYGSSKAAFSAYLSGLRNRLFKSSVHVLTVLPGFVYTKMTESVKLPPLLTAQPDEVAKDVEKAARKKKNIIYTKWHWKYIMLIIKNIPEGIFKKMNV